MGRTERIKSTLIAMVVAVVFIFFIYYGISTFYEKPENIDFCNNTQYNILVESCNGTDECYCGPDRKDCQMSNPEYIRCSADYDDAKNNYNLNVFIVMVTIGGIVILGSFFIPVEAISSGLMGGGLLSVIVGSFMNWGNFKDWMKFILFGILLLALIWFGFKKLRKNDHEEKEMKIEKKGKIF